MFSLPSIPDNFHKALILLGVALLVLAFLAINSTYGDYYKSAKERNAYIDSVSLVNIEIDMAEGRLLKVSEWEALKAGVKNPIYREGDSLIRFVRVFRGNPSEVELSDTLANLWLDYIGMDTRKKQLAKLVDASDFKMKEALQDENTLIWATAMLAIAGLGFMVIGIRRLEIHDELQRKLLEQQIHNENRRCQSCAKVFSYRIKRGSLKNGDASKIFCSNCFQDGEFVEPDLTLDIALSRLKDDRRKLSWISYQQLKNTFPTLERWIKNDY